jgi:hypothetical protein
MSIFEYRHAARRASVARRAARRSRLTGAVVGGLMLFDVGCYNYQPSMGVTPQVGQRISIELSDQGRASLAEQLGPGVLQVEGMLQDVQGDQYVVSVNKVRSINNGSANWGGERVKIPKSDVASTGVRSLSKGRTILTVGLAILAIGAFIVTRAVNSSGFQPGPGGDGGPVSGT